MSINHKTETLNCTLPSYLSHLQKLKPMSIHDHRGAQSFHRISQSPCFGQSSFHSPPEKATLQKKILEKKIRRIRGRTSAV